MPVRTERRDFLKTTAAASAAVAYRCLQTTCQFRSPENKKFLLVLVEVFVSGDIS